MLNRKLRSTHLFQYVTAKTDMHARLFILSCRGRFYWQLRVATIYH